MKNALPDHFLNSDSSNKRLLRQKRKKDDYLFVPESYLENERMGLRNGRWTLEEHERFIKGVFKYGNNWKEIANLIETRNCPQARSHGQKFFHKLIKSNTQGITNEMCNVKFLSKKAITMEEQELKKLVAILLQAHVNFENLENSKKNSFKSENEIEELKLVEKLPIEESLFNIDENKKLTNINSSLCKNYEEDTHDLIKNCNFNFSHDISFINSKNRSTYVSLTDHLDFSDDEEILINQPNEYTFDHINNSDFMDSFLLTDLKDPFKHEEENSEEFNHLLDTFNSFLSKSKQSCDRYYEMMKSKMFTYMKERGEIKEEEVRTGIFNKILLLISYDKDKMKKEKEFCFDNFFSLPEHNQFD